MTPSDSVAAKAPPVGRTWMVGNDHRAPVIVAALDGSAPSRCTTALAAGLIKTMGWRLALVPVPLTATDADRRSRLVAAALDEHAALIASPATDHRSVRRGGGRLPGARGLCPVSRPCRAPRARHGASPEWARHLRGRRRGELGAHRSSRRPPGPRLERKARTRPRRCAARKWRCGPRPPPRSVQWAHVARAPLFGSPPTRQMSSSRETQPGDCAPSLRASGRSW